MKPVNKKDRKSFGRHSTITHTLASSAISLICAAAPTVAAESADPQSPWKFSGELVLGGFVSDQDFSPAGRSSVKWSEGYLKLGLTGDFALGANTDLYGGASLLYSYTGGDGDAGGFSTGNESEVDFEDAFVGFRFNNAFGGAGSVDFSLGSQNFAIGDGFLINGDALNPGTGISEEFNRGGAYWLAARKAFRETAILKLDFGNDLRGDVFYLGSDTALQGDTKLAGVNLEKDFGELGTIGGSYVRVVDVNTSILGGFLANRDDLEAISLRASGSLGVENLFLSGEFVSQSRDGGGGRQEVDAYAGYLEASYQFADMPWAPQLGYRYSVFSGDDASTAASEAYDPLFYGFSRGYGTWFQGEVAGNYSGPFNTNSKVSTLQLAVHPTETLRVGALFFDFTPEQPGGLEAQEFNLFFELPVRENLFVSGLYGRHMPKSGFSAGVDDSDYFSIFAVLNF
ncbi:hypothetical protein GG681_15300 [Epibacterium sp. SM1969]|uniref:Alginate export domain-containing protein n=1 Tax=Tritonibacter aquimaris TaxID=2663379 RepID=A0A844B121_9RHOB|nr:hypothetical protein [Tritonibacter aquimaris]MQY44012.1 hypothetical protein [Tritonibacter aquimaris]